MSSHAACLLHGGHVYLLIRHILLRPSVIGMTEANLIMMQAAILLVFMAIATAAAVLAGQHEEESSPQGHRAWVRAIAYRLFTMVVAVEMAAGSL
jgi:hypothetical protein